MIGLTKAERQWIVARVLLPRYNAWHVAAVARHDSLHALRLERTLWDHVNAHEGIDLPTKITASIGRWIARVLGMQTDRLLGVVP